MSSENDIFIESDAIEPDMTPKNPAQHSPIPERPHHEQDGGYSGATLVSDATVLKRGTLDESVMETLQRDLFEINSRLKQVVYPHFPASVIASIDDSTFATPVCHSSDLWAPLTFIILYSLIVSHAKSLFSSLFITCWSILVVMALHLRLTKPHQPVSLISYVSESGYCLFPQVVQSLLTQIVIPMFLKVVLKGKTHWQIRISAILELFLMAVCLLWSLSAISLVTNAKGYVQVYPLALCFFGLAWLSTTL